MSASEHGLTLPKVSRNSRRHQGAGRPKAADDEEKDESLWDLPGGAREGDQQEPQKVEGEKADADEENVDEEGEEEELEEDPLVTEQDVADKTPLPDSADIPAATTEGSGVADGEGRARDETDRQDISGDVNMVGDAEDDVISVSGSIGVEDHEPKMVGQGIRIKVKKLWPSKTGTGNRRERVKSLIIGWTWRTMRGPHLRRRP